VLEYAECLTRTPAEVADELFERLRARLDERQLVELTATIAWENYLGRFNRGFAIEPQGFAEGGFCLLPERRDREHRRLDEPTDVLSFPVDEGQPAAGPRELGDVVVCPEHAAELVEAVVHGVLHLCGYDHERDDGQMLDLQRRVLASL
jgi:rRNA maturation RNase YbeY